MSDVHLFVFLITFALLNLTHRGFVSVISLYQFNHFVIEVRLKHCVRPFQKAYRGHDLAVLVPSISLGLVARLEVMHFAMTVQERHSLKIKLLVTGYKYKLR